MGVKSAIIGPQLSEPRIDIVYDSESYEANGVSILLTFTMGQVEMMSFNRVIVIPSSTQLNSTW